LTWMARQSWCNGRVGLCGISLSSYSLFLLATLPPPAGIEIKTVVNMMGAVDLHSAFYPGGALMLHWALPWSAMMHEMWMNQPGGWQTRLSWHDLFRRLPLAAVSESVQTNRLWNDLL